MIKMTNTDSAEFRERTSAQIHVQPSYNGELPKTSDQNASFYKKVRKMRKDPTVAMARWLSIAPVLVSPWSVEAENEAPDGAKEFISKVMSPLRSHILETAFFGCLDFGWAPYEKVFKVVYEDDEPSIVMRKLKPLLHDITDIMVDPADGSFQGFSQYNDHTHKDVYLSVDESLLINFEVEGSNWYGEPIMKVVETAYDRWERVAEGADRYDRKVAGSHWIIKYPRGTTKINGVDTDNFQVARNLLTQLENSAGIAVPKHVSEFVDDLNKDAPDAWDIELVTDQGGHVYYTERSKYLDALKVRAFGLPERSVLEGQFGTKAEAEAHGDLGLTLMEHRHGKIVQHVNWHIVDHLMRMNYGDWACGTVYVKNAPLADLERMYLRDIYKAILNNPDLFLTEMESIDLEALKDRLGVPVKPLVDVDVEGYAPDVTGYDQAVDDYSLPEYSPIQDLLPVNVATIQAFSETLASMAG